MRSTACRSGSSVMRGCTGAAGQDLKRRQLTDTERAVARQSLTYPHDKVGNNLDSIGFFQQRPMTDWALPTS